MCFSSHALEWTELDQQIKMKNNSRCKHIWETNGVPRTGIGEKSSPLTWGMRPTSGVWMYRPSKPFKIQPSNHMHQCAAASKHEKGGVYGLHFPHTRIFSKISAAPSKPHICVVWFSPQNERIIPEKFLPIVILPIVQVAIFSEFPHFRTEFPHKLWLCSTAKKVCNATLFLLKIKKNQFLIFSNRNCFLIENVTGLCEPGNKHIRISIFFSGVARGRIWVIFQPNKTVSGGGKKGGVIIINWLLSNRIRRWSGIRGRDPSDRTIEPTTDALSVCGPEPWPLPTNSTYLHDLRTNKRWNSGEGLIRGGLPWE